MTSDRVAAHHARLQISLFVLASAALIIARRPEILTRPQMYAESAPVFYIPTFFHDPLSLIGTPYAGYLHLLPRLVASLERLAPPDIVPLVEGLIAVAITASIAGFIASERLANVLPARWTRQVLALAVIVIPSAREVLGVEINLQVYGSIYLVALAIATRAPTSRWLAADLIGAALAGLSGPFSVLLLPLFLARRTPASLMVGAAALVQLAVGVTSPQRVIEVPAAGDAIAALAMRLNTAMLGPTVAQVLPAALALVLAAGLAVIALTCDRRSAWIALGYGAAVIGFFGLLSRGVAAEVARNSLSFERFFVMIPVAIATLILSGLTSERVVPRRVARWLGALMLAGVLIHLRLPPLPDADWPAQSRCIDAARPCLIEVVPRRFSVVWPGRGGSYEAPRYPDQVVNRVLTDEQ